MLCETLFAAVFLRASLKVPFSAAVTLGGQQYEGKGLTMRREMVR